MIGIKSLLLLCLGLSAALSYETVEISSDGGQQITSARLDRVGADQKLRAYRLTDEAADAQVRELKGGRGGGRNRGRRGMMGGRAKRTGIFGRFSKDFTVGGLGNVYGSPWHGGKSGKGSKSSSRGGTYAPRYKNSRMPGFFYRKGYAGKRNKMKMTRANKHRMTKKMKTTMKKNNNGMNNNNNNNGMNNNNNNNGMNNNNNMNRRGGGNTKTKKKGGKAMKGMKRNRMLEGSGDDAEVQDASNEEDRELEASEDYEDDEEMDDEEDDEGEFDERELEASDDEDEDELDDTEEEANDLDRDLLNDSEDEEVEDEDELEDTEDADEDQVDRRLEGALAAAQRKEEDEVEDNSPTQQSARRTLKAQEGEVETDDL